MTFARLPMRSLVCVCALGWLASVTARASEPAPLTAGLETALSDAQILADQHPGTSVVRVMGESMVPFFSTGAVLVIRPATVEALRPGLVAVYVNASGETIAHRVTKRVKAGWNAQGYHNSQPDSAIVDQSNLRGVVYATFHPRGAGKPVNVAQLAERVRTTPVVLAAPAK